MTNGALAHQPPPIALSHMNNKIYTSAFFLPTPTCQKDKKEKRKEGICNWKNLNEKKFFNYKSQNAGLISVDRSN